MLRDSWLQTIQRSDLRAMGLILRTPGTPAPQDHDRQDQTSDDLPPPPPKKVRASYSVGCKASLRLSALTPSHIPFMGLRRGNFRVSLPGLAAITYAKHKPSRLSMSF
jgi:hypothetical protein